MTLDRPCIKKDHALRNKSKNLTVHDFVQVLTFLASPSHLMRMSRPFEDINSQEQIRTWFLDSSGNKTLKMPPTSYKLCQTETPCSKTLAHWKTCNGSDGESFAHYVIIQIIFIIYGNSITGQKLFGQILLNLSIGKFMQENIYTEQNSFIAAVVRAECQSISLPHSSPDGCLALQGRATKQ